MTPVQAEQIANALLEIAEAKETVSKKAVFGAGKDEISFEVARKGRGILISGEDVQTERVMKASLTPGMARDLARIIRNEAARAAKHLVEE
jgi:hypothetical protein